MFLIIVFYTFRLYLNSGFFYFIKTQIFYYSTRLLFQECALKCCDHKKCNVAMMTGQSKSCIGVRCFNTSSCETVPADQGEEDLQIAHIAKDNLQNVTIGMQRRI